MNEFEMWLEVDGDLLLVDISYEYEDADPSVGLKESFTVYATVDGKEIELSEDEINEVEEHICSNL